jgi:hypothetical protein
VDGGRVACGDTKRTDGVREPDLDWLKDVAPGQRCSRCARELGVEGHLEPDVSLG